MNQQLSAKLKQLPTSPGVYFHKDSAGKIIYIGKAAVLRNRVRQYFQKSRTRDPKTEALIAQIYDTDWTETETEIDALFLEAELVRRYLPEYNILLRDDKSLSYIRIDTISDRPSVTITRRPLGDNAEYFGPYINSYEIKKALRVLRRIFPYFNSESSIGHKSSSSFAKSNLYKQIGLEPEVDTPEQIDEYRKNLRKLISYIKGNRVALIHELESDMKQAALVHDYELAATYRNKLIGLKALTKQIIFSDREYIDLSKDRGLQGLAELLGMSKPAHRIEGYDISHMSGSDNVASGVVFVNGIPDKSSYRKYKMRLLGNNDFAHMSEVISRRLSPKNVAKWGIPDLILIDGGKGQLSSAMMARNHLDIVVPMIGLAKKYETIITEEMEELHLPPESDIIKLLQRIRDESHRFAVSYHSTLKQKRQIKSTLDDIQGVGPATKKKLIKHFGSLKFIKESTLEQLEKVVNRKLAQKILDNI
jgi:excinuclease ABC subunit C